MEVRAGVAGAHLTSTGSVLVGEGDGPAAIATLPGAWSAQLFGFSDSAMA